MGREVTLGLRSDQLRRDDESAAAWANRLRRERGVEGIEWYEREDGSLGLRSIRQVQSKLDL